MILDTAELDTASCMSAGVSAARSSLSDEQIEEQTLQLSAQVNYCTPTTAELGPIANTYRGSITGISGTTSVGVLARSAYAPCGHGLDPMLIVLRLHALKLSHTMQHEHASDYGSLISVLALHHTLLSRYSGH